MGHSAGPAWERLRRILVTRRVQLDPAYANRGVFARSEGVKVSYAVIRDLETGARVNFDPATLALADASYRYAAGSIQRVISGGDPAPLEDIREEAPSESAEAPEPDPNATLDSYFERISDLPPDEYDREIGRVLRRAQAIRAARDREAG